MKMQKKSHLTFVNLVDSIRKTHDLLSQQTHRAINIGLTLRNWIIGYYIREYEQKGEDRAQYGRKLLKSLGTELQKSLNKCYSERYLRLCRQFYETYPQIRKSPISELANHTGYDPVKIMESAPLESDWEVKKMLQNLSFTHFVELISIKDDTKRAFYETECLGGNWSVRELKRQISTLYYERSALSENKKQLSLSVQSKAEQNTMNLTIRDPYIFEFLGLKPSDVMLESDLENALIYKLQEFLLELGHGFCFESRQKRILIGNKHYFIDLVFYHRILKCHVLIELKVDEFKHEYIGQLNTYVSWYKKNIMVENDNPPVGILLCTQKDHSLVEYALAGMDNNLFVSKYQLELPKKEEMQKFIEEQMKEIREQNRNHH